MQADIRPGRQTGCRDVASYRLASRDPDIKYWSNRHWEKMFLHNTTFERNGVNDIDARTLWHYAAIVVSPALISTTPGAGTAYLTSFVTIKARILMVAKRINCVLEPNRQLKISGR